MDKTKIAEFAFDIQTGLGRVDVPDFDYLRQVGMAATLAVHLRGLGEIEYEVLRKVSDFYFDIPSYALPQVLNILGELEFAIINSVKGKIKTIIPQIPHFQNIYTVIGDFVDDSDLNEHEQAILAILNELHTKPENKDRLLNKSGMGISVLDRCLRIGETGGFLREHRARGKSILVSPYYFADNLDGFSDLVAKVGSTEIQKLLQIIKQNQGWPLSLTTMTGCIGGYQLNKQEQELLHVLASEGIIKPPTVEFKNATESFIFTPHPGSARLTASNREIYERAMALISSVRKGQLLPEEYRIRNPLWILRALKDRGYLKSNSEAAFQYRNLVVMRVGYLKPVTSNRWQFHLHQAPENTEALDLAINILQTGELANMEVKQEARLALSKDEKYIQSLVAASELRKRQKDIVNKEAATEFEQLILKFA